MDLHESVWKRQIEKSLIFQGKMDFYGVMWRYEKSGDFPRSLISYRFTSPLFFLVFRRFCMAIYAISTPSVFSYIIRSHLIFSQITSRGGGTLLLYVLNNNLVYVRIEVFKKRLTISLEIGYFLAHKLTAEVILWLACSNVIRLLKL